MKQILKIVGLLFLLTIVAYVTWWNLPVTINRYWDIRLGNSVIDKIDEYKKTNGLPDSNDWGTLKKLGFEDHLDYYVPEYAKLNDEDYELRFIEGFDGPYLIWNSQERNWSIDMPTFPDERMRRK